MTNLPFRLFIGYVGIVFIGSLLSVSPLLTVYRGIELSAGVLAVSSALRKAGQDGIRRLQRILFSTFLVLLGTVWIGVILAPGQAIKRSDAPIPFQVYGTFPNISSNSVGTMGALVALWAIAELTNKTRSKGRLPLLALMSLGVISLAAAQYRTGYIAFVAGLLLILFLRGRLILASLSGVAASGLLFFGSPNTSSFEAILLRGQTQDQAMRLTGRLSFWSHAIEVWQTSPLLGRGLVTATRFEVLAPLGLGNTSTIHGTWVEALVGTGILGVTLLALSFLLALKTALSRKMTARSLIPAVLLFFILVRSLTGTTFEIFGIVNLLFLVAVLAKPDDLVANSGDVPVSKNLLSSVS